MDNQSRQQKVFHLTVFILCIFQLHATQSRKVINPHPFTYHLNNEKLCEDKPDTLIWIHSSPGHLRHRTFIRDSWGNPKHYKKRNIQLVFFLGVSLNHTSQALIEYESQIYGDIVQETFIDSYRNLTYKAIAGCKWTSTYCKSADIILKSDDDMVINIYLLFRHIDSLRSEGKVMKNTMLCDVWRKRHPTRKKGKWYVTNEEYAAKDYPPYCPGLVVIMTGDLAQKLYAESRFQKYFWVDDVYFTGLLAKTINVTFEQLASTVHFGTAKRIKDDANFYRQFHWMFYHTHSFPLLHMMWRMIYTRDQMSLYQDIPHSV